MVRPIVKRMERKVLKWFDHMERIRGIEWLRDVEGSKRRKGPKR